ncbi:DUF624 domain-containing protein [Lederbergia wuyishanensis]|uniref:Membrane protein YesL n=1 Tax=Lederbergia wuyishanensis TaxID=1347903 RepID=A0ABU0D435_9BACI|nr:putative membrane protein YesL [Lederbergia wuyishanensis]
MFLNILFIISCIPIITIFPAISALFGVVRQWKRNNDVYVVAQFRKMFTENWKQSYLVGILTTLIGGFLVFDFYLLYHTDISYKTVIFVALMFIIFLFMICCISIYPLMVHLKTSFKRLCISSLQVGLFKIHLSLFCLILLAAWTTLSLRFIILFVFFFFSVSAYIIYWIADVKFNKLKVKE